MTFIVGCLCTGLETLPMIVLSVRMAKEPEHVGL